MGAAIDVQNIVRSYRKVDALKGVSFTVPKSEIFGIIGLSGAGKSTLIRLINGLESTSSGRISIDSIDIHALSKKN